MCDSVITKYGMYCLLEWICSSMAVSLYFWQGRFIPLIFSWKVVGSSVLKKLESLAPLEEGIAVGTVVAG